MASGNLNYYMTSALTIVERGLCFNRGFYTSRMDSVGAMVCTEQVGLSFTEIGVIIFSSVRKKAQMSACFVHATDLQAAIAEASRIGT